MEQKFTFKRFLSLFVVCAMLLSSFAAFAVTAGAVDVYWAEGDYSIADNGNYSANHAYGYVFNVKAVNGTIGGEDAVIITNNTAYEASNPKWAAHVLLAPVEGDVYEIVATIPYAGGSGAQSGYEKGINFDDGKICLLVHSSASYPAYKEDGVTLEYANWEAKVAALALANTIGARVTLAGIDLEAGTATDATVTVQDAPIEMTVDGDLSEWADNWTEVNAENGYWQNLPADENADAPYKFQMYDDGETLYVAAELSVVESTGLRIWFRTNDEATVYTSFYDIKADSVVGKYNQSLTTNSGAVIADSTAAGAYVVGEESITVEFAVTFEELGAVDGAFDYYINTFDGVGTLYYPPVVEGEGGNRLANLPYNNWYVEPTPDPEPEVPTENKNVAFGKNYDVTSGNGKESYAQYTANLTDGNIAEAISYDGNWFAFYNNAAFPDDINVTDGGVGTVVVDLGGSYNITDLKVYTIDVNGASGIKVIKSIKAYVSEDGETWSDAIVLDIPTGILNATFAATAEVDLVANFVKFDVETDGIFGFINEIEVYADVPVEEEPTPDPEVVPYTIPVGSINAYGWGNDGYPVILAYGEGGNVESKVGGFWFEWWFKVKAEWNETEGAFIVNATGASGNKDYEAWTFNANEIVFLVYSGTETYAAEKDILANLAIGDKLYASGFDFTNASANNLIVDGASTVNFSNVEFEEEPTPEVPELPEGAIALDYAGYVHDSYFEILAADNKTVADLTTLGIGEAKDMNYFYVAVVGADNVITEMYTSLGRPDGVKSDVVCPEGGYIIGLNANKAGADALLEAKVGDSIVLYNVDVESFRGAEGSIALENAGFAIVPASEPEPEEPTGTNVLLGVAFDKLTGTYYTYGSAVTDGSELTDGYYITAENLDGALYADDNVAGFGGLHNGTLELEGALDGAYAIDKIVVHYANGKTGSGICEPGIIKAFYKNGEGEWIQFGTTFESTETDDNMSTRYDFLISSVEFTVDTAVEATDIRFEMSPRSGKAMVFLSELEAWGTKVETEEPGEEDAYKEGLTIEIDDTLVGWIGDAADLETIENGLTDDNWGAGDANDWSNASGIYPFSNKVCTDNTQFPEVNLIYNFGEATKFDTIDLGIYSSYNVMIGYPSALVYVYTSEDGVEWSEGVEAYFDMGWPELGNEGSVKTTAKLPTALEAKYAKVVLTFPESPFESKPVWEFMGLTEIAISYNPVTSNVVTDFNPEGYKSSIGGATGAFIYDDADIYAACRNDWWIHVAFVPSEVMEGYYEVATIRAPTTGNYLTMPENGFIWMAWSDAGGTPESAGAYALAFMSNLKVGDIVEFVGVDFANHTTEADAYAEVWVDPNAPVNVALGKDYTLSGAEDATYNANLTDGNAFGAVSYDNKWFVFNAPNTVDGIGTAIIDLAGDFDISKVQVNLINNTVDGIAKPEYVKFYVSADGEAWEELGEVELQDVQGSAYWTGLENLEVTGRYIKLEMKIGAPFSFLNEIEVYGKEVPADAIDVELVEGENEITVPALNSAIANTNFDKDYVIIISGQWNVTVVVNGEEYWPNRMGNLEAPLPAGENTVEFKNSSEEDSAIVAIVEAPTVGDTMDDPIALDKGGDYTADVTDKYPEGVYYQYTATEDGTVTITINTESGWLYVINNVTAGKYGDMHWSDDETPVVTETIEVSAGDVIMIQVATYDPENPYSAPVGTVDFTLVLPGASAPETAEIALGDVNMDGVVNQYDYILIKRHHFETIDLNDGQLLAADANGDGTVNQYDYILVKRHYFETFVIEGTVEVATEFLPSEE